MSSKALREPVYSEKSSTATSIDSIEAKYFYRPEEDQFITTLAAQRKVDKCRVQVRGGIDALLTGTYIGQLLVSTLVEDPLQKEKAIREDDIIHYTNLLQVSGILSEPEMAAKYARSYYDVLPLSAPIIVLQMQIQGNMENSLKPILLNPNFSNLLQWYQDTIKSLYQRCNLADLGISEKEVLQLFLREFVWKTKIQITHLLCKQKYTELLSLLAALESLSNEEQIDLWTYLPLETNHLSEQLSENPQQRKVLTDFSIRKMVCNGLESFDEFSIFLQKMKVKKLQGEELKTLFDYAYLERNLDLAWKRNMKNYFEIIEFLMDIEILSPSYPTSDKILHRSIEYYLTSYFNGEYQSMKKDILPHMLKLGIFPQKPNDPRQHSELLDKYDQLCIRLNLEKNVIVRQNYDHSKKHDKSCH